MRRFDQDDREGGYILALTGLLVVVLFVFAAFSIDVGSWYARAAQIQRSADAAALAGVVWMPDLTKAQQAATDAASKNGFTTGTNNVTVTVSAVAGNTHRLQVTITDAAATQYFSQLVLNHQSITRTATAEYLLPVPLGSPKNAFGTGTLLPSPNTENFWAAANGYCAGRESGDLGLAHDESTYSGGQMQCGGLSTNPNYDPNGYFYAIDLAQAPGQSVTIEIYDPAYNSSGSNADVSVSGSPTSITTTYKVYGADNTPLDNTDNPLLYTYTAPSGDTTYRNAWMPLYTITSPVAGQYYLRVSTQAGEAASIGSNGFGIRARVGSSFLLCSTETGSTNPPYQAWCPQVHGVDAMSIYGNQPGSTATFHLAQIDPVHAGKTMEVELFDPGEGANTIQVLDPNGNAANFTWTTDCNPPTPPTGGCSGSGTSLDVSSTGTQPYANIQGTGKYNDRTIILKVALPNNYSSLYGTKTWWKIKYTTSSGGVTDRTTWLANILGDPVHLVQ
jgi:Flp pilus assembly protein TadG